MEIWSLGLFFLENSGPWDQNFLKILVPGLKFSETVFPVTDPLSTEICFSFVIFHK